MSGGLAATPLRLLCSASCRDSGYGRCTHIHALRASWGRSADRNLHSKISILANDNGGVVRRPFSTLQAWLIAVSPQPGVALAIGKKPRGLDPSRSLPLEDGDEAAGLRPRVVM